LEAVIYGQKERTNFTKLIGSFGNTAEELPGSLSGVETLNIHLGPSSNSTIEIALFIERHPVNYSSVLRSLNLREEHGLRMFENGVLRRIFGPKSGSERRIEKIT
jgi:hypothetical protein